MNTTTRIVKGYLKIQTELKTKFVSVFKFLFIQVSIMQLYHLFTLSFAVPEELKTRYD